MINRQRVSPVGCVSENAICKSKLLSSDQLRNELEQRGLSVQLGAELKGGVVSKVYEARLADGGPVVIKYSGDWEDDNPTMVRVSRAGHNVDAQLLDFLSAQSRLRVPKVFHHFEDIPLTIMEDLRTSGFMLLSTKLCEGNLPLNCARTVGTDIAQMQQTFARHPEFTANESAWQSFYERGFELRLAYPNDPHWYNELEHRFTSVNLQLTAVDTHPKNMFVDAEGALAWIDFGRSVWADRDFALPNCLAHIAVYGLAGLFDRSAAARFISDAVAEYRKILPVEDEVFCKYFACEILHRWAGKWITGVDTVRQKTNVLTFGLKIFDNQLFKLDSVLSALGDN